MANQFTCSSCGQRREMDETHQFTFPNGGKSPKLSPLKFKDGDETRYFCVNCQKSKRINGRTRCGKRNKRLSPSGWLSLPAHASYPTEFNKIGKETYRMLEKTAKYVLRALALYLNLEETYFDAYIYNGNSILRPIHYPPIEEEPKEAVRAAAHGDINLITLLMGAQGRGLQVQNHKGEWIDAIAQPDELMINVGDMLSRHTNNRVKSTIHRVVNPPKELWGTSRYAMPFFMHPISDMKLDVLESCIDKDHPKVFENITAGEFLNERLIELGLVKK